MGDPGDKYTCLVTSIMTLIEYIDLIHDPVKSKYQNLASYAQKMASYLLSLY